MSTVANQIQSADTVICSNIESLTGQRALISQNILAQLRNLVEGTCVLLSTNSPNEEFDYSKVGSALAFVKRNAKFNFLGKFHKLIQQSASHYTLDGDASERLMLKYYEYLHRIRSLLRSNSGISVLSNLEAFPIDLDPSLREYHEKIAAKIDSSRSTPPRDTDRSRYYIQKTRPFFCSGRIYYEVTFCRAINKVSKFDRIIAFTDIDITDKYAANLTLCRDSIEVLGKTMPITIALDWKVSIRPCEFDNFARILGIFVKTRTNWPEYQYLMDWLTAETGSLLDLVNMTDDHYARFKEAGADSAAKKQLFPIIDEVRRITSSSAPGQNILRYLLLRMHNLTLKQQYYRERCDRLSGMKLKYSCNPFETMPFCTSLVGHNPRFWDLIASLDATDREHELLARHIKNNVETHGILYTPIADIEKFGDVNKLVSIYNNKLYYKHTNRKIMLDKGHAFIHGYEKNTASIVKTLQDHATSGIAGYTQAVKRWLRGSPRGIDDPVKEDALKVLFSQSRVALIYGAAGTGKSTMVDHIAHYFNDKEKLFLAHTNPAIDNLKRKVTAQNSEFRTITSHIHKSPDDKKYDLLIIDECSTVSNASLMKVLEETSFKLLVLVGDAYQIEAIQFGNWFGLVKSFIPSTSVFELTTPFRTKSQPLLDFWGKVRNIEEDIAESIARNGYSTVLDKTLFEAREQDEIILCLNYDGLYGINNVNRFLQSSNPSAETTWRESTYKVGDPVLFHESDRFRPVIYNNLKGIIVAIDRSKNQIQFDVELDRPLTELDVVSSDLEWVEGSTVRFSVDGTRSSDDDDDSLNTTVPFQVAYAVSIHKAQGLEFKSVKVVITDANEDNITHSIFYTAVTRAREHLRIFWTPETQQSVLKKLNRTMNPKDSALLSQRFGLSQARN